MTWSFILLEEVGRDSGWDLDAVDSQPMGTVLHVASDCEAVQSDLCHQGSPGHKKDGIVFS